MEFQLFKLGENDKRFLQLRRIWRLRRPRSLSSLRSGTLLGDSLRLLGQLRLVTPLGCCSAILVLVVLLLDDFLGVRDVSWVSHQFIDGSQRSAGRISRWDCSRPSTNEARRECRLNPQREANAVSFYFDQAHQRMGTETDETSGRAVKLDCLKQSSSFIRCRIGRER